MLAGQGVSSTKPELLRFRFDSVLDDVDIVRLECIQYLLRGDTEELSTAVDPIEPMCGERMVKSGLDTDCVICEEEGVNIESEWH